MLPSSLYKTPFFPFRPFFSLSLSLEKVSTFLCKGERRKKRRKKEASETFFLPFLQLLLLLHPVRPTKNLQKEVEEERRLNGEREREYNLSMCRLKLDFEDWAKSFMEKRMEEGKEKKRKRGKRRSGEEGGGRGKKALNLLPFFAFTPFSQKGNSVSVCVSFLFLLLLLLLLFWKEEEKAQKGAF